jgi:hypothetical protein
MSQLSSVSGALRRRLIENPEDAKIIIGVSVAIMNATEWSHDYLVSALEYSLGISDEIDEIIADAIWQESL